LGSKPCYILKIVKISNIIFDMPPYLQNGTHRGCLLEAVGGWDNLWNLLYDLLMGFLEPKQSFILVNFVFQDRQKDFFWVEVNQV